MATSTDKMEIIRHINGALSNPNLCSRITDLTSVIQVCSLEDLKSVFPTIMENIFGVGMTSSGWGLRSLTKNNSAREVNAILRFLGPEGPLISLAYHLMEDASLKFEFPLRLLPVNLQNRILGDKMSPYLASKVFTSCDPTDRFTQIKSLHLNPFEYYFFYFAVLNWMGSPGDTSQYLIGWGSMTDTVYISLLDDYLMYFFPCGGDTVPAVKCRGYGPSKDSFVVNKSYPGFMNTLAGISSMESPAQSSSSRRHSLLKDSVFLQDRTTGQSILENSLHSASSLILKENWRSDSILNIFMEVWMSVPEKEPGNSNSALLDIQALPCVDLVKAVRMIIRHFHYFSNCVNSHNLHPMEDVKRCNYPLLQKKAYCFLRHLFNYWPLDNSFRIVYETWLSYIQPWRYVNFRAGHTRHEGSDAPVDNRWYNFISENILFYSRFLQKIIERLIREDLSSPKNALMLYRVAKVYGNQETLKIILSKIEDNLIKFDSSHEPISISTPYGTSSSSDGVGRLFQKESPVTNRRSNRNSSSFSSPDAHGMSNAMLAHIRAVIRELENQDFKYQPIFSLETKCAVKHLMACALKTQEHLVDSVKEIEEENNSDGWFYSYIASLWSYPPRNNQDLQIKKKAINHLLFSNVQLGKFFDLAQPSSVEDLNQSFQLNTSFSPLNVRNGEVSEDIEREDQVARRTPILPNGTLTDGMLGAVGNPDNMLPRSDECRPIVKLMMAISALLNAMCQPRIEEIYFNRHMLGKIMRTLVAQPREYVEIQKTPLQRHIRRTVYLPPRVNLRFVGSHLFIYTFLSIFVVGFILGVTGVVGWFLWLFFLLNVYIFVKVLTEPADYHDQLWRKFGKYLVADDVNLMTGQERYEHYS